MRLELAFANHCPCRSFLNKLGDFFCDCSHFTSLQISAFAGAFNAALVVVVVAAAAADQMERKEQFLLYPANNHSTLCCRSNLLISEANGQATIGAHNAYRARELFRDNAITNTFALLSFLLANL